jgi:L-ribulose-5-phosphate 4-epimerase
MSNYKTIKEEAYRANMRLPELGLVLFTFGNASAADREAGVFAIKPSGVPYEDLTASDMVIVDFESNVVEGDLRPSSDTKTHAYLYKTWTRVGGIVHTHSTYATGWAQSLTDLPVLGTTHADHMAMDIPCTQPMDDEKIKGDYEYETGRQIVEEFERRDLSPDEASMTLVGQHAPFTWGDTVQKAVYNSAVLEEIAKMAMFTRQIRPDSPRLKNTLIQKHYQRKHGKNSYYGQN